ncbi:MAG TPA: hypothetical protein DCL61_00780 [Cyanobacteria bacterium UBA12227]|nr:hypothetical protein [Cyanobacteria bacterium UBA12227]HAX84894.1 hypothetical protein [Cyanobacteria bacterium UBA11370]HBY77316.1 hypothetical protein [Cyanobacteria bacterium UBA11148]
MKHLDPFYNSRPSRQGFFAPMLLVAFVLHGLLLMIPVSADPEKPKSSEDEKEIQVQSSPSQQPTSQISSNQTNATSDKEELSEQKSDPKLATNQTTAKPNITKTTNESSSQKPSTSTRQPSSTSSVSQSEPNSNPESSSNPPQNQTSASIPTFSQQQTPDVSSSIPEPQQPLDTSQQKPGLTSMGNFIRGFPYYLGSWLTSGGILNPKFNDSTYIYYTIDELQDVARNFEKQLKDKGFTIITKTEQDNFKVYQVSKGEPIQFLHLIYKDGKTAIFVDNKIHSLEELQIKETPKKSDFISDFYDAFKQKIRDNQDLQLKKIRPSDFDQLSQSETLQKLNRQTDNVEQIIETLLLDRLEVITSPSQPISPEQLASRISSELSKGEDKFKIEKVGTYGDGELYEIKKDDLKIYMILVSTNAGEVSRTAILLSQNDPSH